MYVYIYIYICICNYMYMSMYTHTHTDCARRYTISYDPQNSQANELSKKSLILLNPKPSTLNPKALS